MSLEQMRLRRSALDELLTLTEKGKKLSQAIVLSDSFQSLSEPEKMLVLDLYSKELQDRNEYYENHDESAADAMAYDMDGGMI